jgi:dTDP-4-amino-4,6-dideoxygalactose transaminase
LIPINLPLLGEEEVEAVKEVLLSGRLTEWRVEGGPLCRRFEEAFASYVGVKNAVAMSSGTAALHAALMALNVGPGDEVIVPDFTFVATANVVLLAGATPVLVDIDPETYDVSLEEVKKALTERTKAVVAVHLYGLPADMDPLMELAEEKGLYVIEDAAQAHGSEYKGRRVGALGHLACFSFYSSKVMTTGGEGGMVTTNDDELASRLRSIRTHGQRIGFDTERLGHNYRLTELQAAIGLAQLKKLGGFLEARRRNAKILTESLEGVGCLKLPVEPPKLRHNWYLYTVRASEASLRDRLVEALNRVGIGAAVYYRAPIHATPLHAKLARRAGPLSCSELASKTVLQLPVHPAVTEGQARWIGEKVLQLARELGG